MSLSACVTLWKDIALSVTHFRFASACVCLTVWKWLLHISSICWRRSSAFAFADVTLASIKMSPMWRERRLGGRAEGWEGERVKGLKGWRPDELNGGRFDGQKAGQPEGREGGRAEGSKDKMAKGQRGKRVKGKTAKGRKTVCKTVCWIASRFKFLYQKMITQTKNKFIRQHASQKVIRELTSSFFPNHFVLSYRYGPGVVSAFAKQL